ncbi:MAG: histidine--tRNA ligase [Bacteroidales bacterium]|nr:histidine--tRNA ligase [Bacteroidales bacterium]MBN2762916.1 histidine--tRNA ligase [Bacteroidales bacterium]
MAIPKPSIPKGTRDFSPVEMVRRNYIFDTIKTAFSKYGYLPLETPAMENLDTLLGKYGDEGDRLLFKILNSGDFMKGAEPTTNTNALSLKICEKGLRYDLTVPFARYVVQHQNDIIFPFKRYQIQPVWRADRPQKGRYREFYQCDADVIGSNSLLNEIELIRIMDEVFSQLGIRITIKINNRKILAGISEYIGEAGRITDITVAIDKLDKMGEEKVFTELREKGIPMEAISKIKPLLKISGKAEEQFEVLTKTLAGISTGLRGVEEMHKIFSGLKNISTLNPVEFDVSLARGLNYYTGAIFEVKATDVEIGSICGGGRYDNLTGIFGLPGISGVGISFGADRIYDVMNQLKLFPADVSAASQVMIANFGEKEALFCLSLQAKLLEAGIRAELYPDTVKLGKQIGYAVSRNIPFIALIGENEIKEEKITLKRLSDGNQQSFARQDLIEYLKNQ